MSIEKENNVKKRDDRAVMDAIISKTGFQIYSLLEMFTELSLSQLSQKLKKSKSTIAANAKKMIEVGVVKIEKKQIASEKSGKINTEHFYKFTSDYQEKLSDLSMDLDHKIGISKESAQEFIKFNQGVIAIQKSILDLRKRFNQKMMDYLKEGSEEKTIKILNELIYTQDEQGSFIKDEEGKFIPKSGRGFNTWEYYSEEQFPIFKKKYSEFEKKLKEEFKKMETTESKKEKSILFFGSGIPIKKMLEFINQ